MLDMKLPTADWENPLKLSEDGAELLHTLSLSFWHSGLLHKHVKFLCSHGALYESYNKNLLYHGCIPMKKDDSFDTVVLDGISYSGKSLMDFVGRMVQNAYFLKGESKEKEDARGFM